jgi:hypothetical protein
MTPRSSCPGGESTPLRGANLRLNYEINTLTQTRHPDLPRRLATRRNQPLRGSATVSLGHFWKAQVGHSWSAPKFTLSSRSSAVTISGRLTIYGWCVAAHSGESSACNCIWRSTPPERPLLCFVRNGRGPVSAGSSEEVPSFEQILDRDEPLHLFIIGRHPVFAPEPRKGQKRELSGDPNEQGHPVVNMTFHAGEWTKRSSGPSESEATNPADAGIQAIRQRGRNDLWNRVGRENQEEAVQDGQTRRVQCDDDGTVERGTRSLSSVRNDSTRRS